VKNAGIKNKLKNTPKLTDIQKKLCDNPINESEILTNLKYLKNGRTPGTDDELSIEQKTGILTLLPKKTKNRLLLKNWRPISLLNTDYKLIAKILGSRLQNVLPDLSNEDQSGTLIMHCLLREQPLHVLVLLS
jgi:hypothetical protein